jgi:diacylglycerol kinase (ATP)
LQKAVIIINPACHQGKGWRRWLSIRREVQQRMPANCKEVVLENGVTLKEVLHPDVQQGEPILIVSAGGDGSMHYLVNYLLKQERENARHVTLGAIGLGSSNDFLKPFEEKIKGVPVRINQRGGIVLHDTGIATYSDDANLEQKKFFIVNASVGITAEANWNFNHPGTFLRLLKKEAIRAAIIYTAVSAIVRHRNNALSLMFNEQKLITSISNINILKIPFVSGSFYYRQPIRRDDGQLGLNVCMNMSKLELLSILIQLQRGQFPSSGKTLTEFTTGIHIIGDHAFVFECDGETEKTRSLNITLLPNAITVLRN